MPNRMTGALRRLWLVFAFVAQLLLLAWAALAIYYTVGPWTWLRALLALGLAAFGVWALWFSRRARMRLIAAGLFAVALAWYLSLQPSHDRPWRHEVAVMPRVIVEGDRVRLLDVRNFEYRSVDDFTVRYEDREVSLANLTSVDFFVSYWVPGPVAHTFVSFNFEDAPPVSISIETRPEQGEGFDPIASLFKQFELIYIVADERDVVRVRTDYRDEDVYLYRLRTTPDGTRRLFLAYVERINELADRPEWYHLLKSNCTLNIVRYANVAGREGGFDLRHFLNGWVDQYLYEAGWIASTLPFEELRRRSQINDAARAAGDSADFSRRIRENLPGRTGG